MNRLLGLAALPLAVAVVGCSAGGGPGTGANKAQHGAGVTEPTPPITSSAFHLEPKGSAPADGDGLIPNPDSPDGSAPTAAPACSVTERSSAGATAASVNALIAAKENTISATYVICLSGTFTSPLHVWSKWDSSMLVIESAPGATAALALGEVTKADADPNDHDGGDAGGVDITDSRGVEVRGLDISGLWSNGPDYAPTGILVTVRQSTQTNQGKTPHESACFVESADHACSDVYLIGNTISDIANRADEAANVQKDCNNEDVGAFGIAVLSYGDDDAHALQHVVIEDNTVDHTRTGESETVTVNGDVEDFLEADNTVYDTDNIGMDAIGWEEGTDQARHGLIVDNTVANVDTWGNHSYGRWKDGTCAELEENAAGIYDDGASYVWIEGNTVDNSDQGIDADVETPHKLTDHILVSGNAVLDQRGTSLGQPSTGTNPPGVPGPSDDAGHAFEAFYVDSYGSGSHITEVYAYDNSFQNESQFYGASRSQEAPVVDIAGRWSNVVLWDNTIKGGGAADLLNPVLEVDNAPVSGTTDVLDCTDYGSLSTSSSPKANGNFVLPSGTDYVSFSSWVVHNGHGWDAHSAVGTPSGCPAATP